MPKLHARLLMMLFLCGVHISNAADPVVQPGDNLVVEGIPPLSKDLVEQTKRYTESRAAVLLDWHPDKREILISTRFGNTPQIHHVAMPGGARKQLTFFDEPIGSAEYSPFDADYLLFTRDAGGNEFAQIYRLDLSTFNVELLTDGGRSQNGGWKWDRSKQQIAYASTQRNGADRDIWSIDPRDKTSKKLVVENVGGGWSVTDWSLDNNRLLLREYLSINQSHLWIADVKSGQKTRLTSETEQVAYGDAIFAPDGKGLYVTSDEKDEFKRLGYLELATKQLTPITTTIPWDVVNIDLSPKGDRLAFVTNEAGVSKLYVMETENRQYREIEGIPVGVIGGVLWHSNGRDLAFSINSAQSTSDVYSIDVEDHDQLTRWTESELGGLSANSLSVPELVKWKSFDDREISGFLYRPAKKFTGKRPVIINIHGGPESQSQPVFLARGNYYLNELGVAILYPNVRGSDGFGKTFVALDNGVLREDSVKDIGSLLDWIAKEPTLDADRVMVTGGSYGGYMTLAVATHYSDRIRCSLDVVGISHFGTFLKNTESYRRDLRRVEYGDERNPEIASFFERIAPLNNAEKIKKPLFVVQGGNDPRVPLSEAEQIVAKVKQQGGTVWYLMAKDEGHGFRKKNNADFQFYATIEFIKKYLLN